MQILALQQQNQMLLQNIPTQTAAPTVHTPVPKKVKVPMPDHFNGKWDKVEHFIRQCNLVFSRDLAIFTGYSHKITYTLSLIRGGLAQE